MWILGSFRKEALFFFVPGLISVLIAINFPDLGETSIIYGLIATALIDSGHVYTTAWRTLFHSEERSSSHVYWALPLTFFSVFSIWYYFNLPYLWTFVVYSTLFHHTRQVYGFSKWYQALNKRSDKKSDYFLYALAILPMVIYHFRPGAIANYYSEKDLFLYPDDSIRKSLFVVYLLVAASWMLYEYSLWKKGIKEINRLISVAFPALIYGYAFLVGKTVSQVLFPLLFIHGIAYCAVLSQTLHRTQEKKFKTQLIATIIVFFTAVGFGLSESWFEGNLINISTHFPGLVTSLVIGLYLTPLFCHYAFDALIWRRTHRDSKKIIGH